AVLAYLGRYLFRVAIANSRIESIREGPVTFRYRDNRSQQIRRATLSGSEFLDRFLQHLLPARPRQGPLLRPLESGLPSATRTTPVAACAGVSLECRRGFRYHISPRPSGTSATSLS